MADGSASPALQRGTGYCVARGPPQYRYNIGHSYGKEGKRQNYDAYSCKKIVEASPPAGDEVHGENWRGCRRRRRCCCAVAARPSPPAGCPYRNWDFATIRGTLGRMGIATTQIDDVLDSVRERNYTIACRKQFEARFAGADSSSVGMHPNGYAEAAHKYLKAKRDGSAAGGAGGAGAGAFAATSTAAAAVGGGESAAAAGGGSSGVAAGAGTAKMELAYD